MHANIPAQKCNKYKYAYTSFTSNRIFRNCHWRRPCELGDTHVQGADHLPCCRVTSGHRCRPSSGLCRSSSRAASLQDAFGTARSHRMTNGILYSHCVSLLDWLFFGTGLLLDLLERLVGWLPVDLELGALDNDLRGSHGVVGIRAHICWKLHIRQCRAHIRW